MFPKFTFLQIVLFALTIISGEVTRDRPDKRGRRRNDEADKTFWKKEYEDELNDAILTNKRENFTRSAGPQAGAIDNEAVVEKLLDSITSSERYLKKIEAVEFRLNRLDIEVHEKTNSIMKLLNNMSKSLKTDTCSDKVDSALRGLMTDVNSIKLAVERNPNNVASSGIVADFS